MPSQAYRQGKVKGAKGPSQSGKIVKVFPQGRQTPATHPGAFVPVIVSLAEPLSMSVR